MNKLKHSLWITIVFMALLGAFGRYISADTGGIVSLELTAIGIRHGTPDNLNLGTIFSSTDEQTISVQFPDFFWVEDMEGYMTGHYITVQCDGVYGPYGNKLTGVYLKAGAASPWLIRGGTGENVLIATGLASDYINIIEPITYIYKATAPNNVGKINRYGDKPWLKIVVPGGTPPGIYSGTIVFSFYMY